MSKHYGEDDGGQFVLWTTASGQMNKKYISGPLEGEHQGYDPKTKRSFSTGYDRDWRNEEDTDDSDGGGGSCYIATAVSCADSPRRRDELEILKHWRYTVLERYAWGNRFSAYYRNTAPELAQRLPNHPKVSRLIKHVFVTPGIKLAKARNSATTGKGLYSIGIFSLFVLGLMFGKIAKLITCT